MALQHNAGNQALTGLVEAVQEKGLPRSEAARPVVQDALRSPGRPLDPASRELFESRFDHDLSQVRVHTDEQAAESARAVNAQAYTVGQDVVFGKGQFAPGTGAGQQLLAHELVHVVQQAAQPSLTGQVWREPAKNDKAAKKKSRLLELARKSLDKGLRAINSGKPRKVTAGCNTVKKGISNLNTAAQYAQDSEKGQMMRVARGLAALVAVATASVRKQAPRKFLRGTFATEKDETESVAGSEAIGQGKFAQAAAVYRALPEDFAEIFPDLAFEVPGRLVDLVAGGMEQRLTVMEAMKEAGAAPKSYPPTPGEVEAYFAKLGAAGAKNDEIAQAYEDYVKVFFEPKITPYDPRKFGTAQVYAGKQTVLGTILTDCDGYVRLGIRLLTRAGFRLEKVIVGIRNFKVVVNNVDTYNDAHAVGQLTRDGETVFVSNEWIHRSEKAAFSVAWEHPDAALIKGEGKTVRKANRDALAKIRKEK
jgi:hypothetical protein